MVGLALASIAGLSGNDALLNLAGNVNLLESLKFSREQESAADQTAVAALFAEYGDIGGVDRLFAVFQGLEAESPLQLPAFLSSHPLTEQRIQDLHAFAREHGFAENGPAVPLPPLLRTSQKN